MPAADVPKTSDGARHFPTHSVYKREEGTSLPQFSEATAGEEDPKQKSMELTSGLDGRMCTCTEEHLMMISYG